MKLDVRILGLSSNLQLSTIEALPSQTENPSVTGDYIDIGAKYGSFVTMAP